MTECRQGTQDNKNKVQDQSGTHKDGEQPQGSTGVGRTQNGETSELSQGNTSEEGKSSRPQSFLVGLSLLFILIIALELFKSFVGPTLLENIFVGLNYRCCFYTIFCVIAFHYGFIDYKYPQNKLTFKRSWLIALSLLFILTIVIGLFEKITGNKSLKIEVLNIPLFTIEFIGTNSQGVLYILSLFIGLLSGSIVYQKDKEKKQKQRKMVYKIEKALKELYGEGK